MESTLNRTELDHREGDGVAVTLSWDCAENRVIVSVVDAGGGESLS